MYKETKEIMKALDVMISACNAITEAGACDACPLNLTNCLEDTSFADICYDMPMRSVEDMLALSDDVQNYISEEDYIADLADRERKEIEYGY